MKVFISQPMRDKTDQEILQERADAMNLIRSVHPNAELIDTYIDDDIQEKHAGLQYLAKSIEMLDTADAVWMLKGWAKARGCRIEHECALAYNIPVYYLY